jgi:hypothetical protein
MKLPPVMRTLLEDSKMGITESFYRDPEPYVGDDYKLTVIWKDRWKVLRAEGTWKFRLHYYHGLCLLTVNCHSQFTCKKNYKNPHWSKDTSF